jgi:hypothetical protein
MRWRRVGDVVAVALLLGAAAAAAAAAARHDYEEALRKSLLYFEAQRSGRLPHGQRVAWRDHSGLTDGLEQGVRLHLLSLSVLAAGGGGGGERRRG